MSDSAWPCCRVHKVTFALCLPSRCEAPIAFCLYTITEAAVACRQAYPPATRCRQQDFPFSRLPCHSVGGLTHLQAQEAIAQALEDWDPKSDSHATVRLGASAPPVCSQRLACPVSCVLAAVSDCMHHQPQSLPLSSAPAPARPAVSVMQSLASSAPACPALVVCVGCHEGVLGMSSILTGPLSCCMCKLPACQAQPP